MLLPFGNIVFCNFIGQEHIVNVLIGGISVRSALIEYKSAVCAAECCTNMNGFSLGGVHLLCEMVDQSMAAALKGKRNPIYKIPFDVQLFSHASATPRNRSTELSGAF